jgi:hypothetical protein
MVSRAGRYMPGRVRDKVIQAQQGGKAMQSFFAVEKKYSGTIRQGKTLWLWDLCHADCHLRYT